MLTVKTPAETLDIITDQFHCLATQELVPLEAALGRVLAEDILAQEFVPDFDRSSVDGYAVRSADTFGCSTAIPAIFPLQGAVEMGESAPALAANSCLYVPTGGAIPAGADAMVMIEYSEDYGDGTIGLSKPASPGKNIVFRGDDVKPGQLVLPQGRKLGPQDIGALAALGWSQVPVRTPIRIGVISTGASNDIEQATKLARGMITRYGMSEAFDMVALETVTNQYLGGDASLACSAETQTQIDHQVVALVKKEHAKAVGILTENRAKLDELAKYLYEKETITGEEFMAILNRA